MDLFGQPMSARSVRSVVTAASEHRWILRAAIAIGLVAIMCLSGFFFIATGAAAPAGNVPSASPAAGRVLPQPVLSGSQLQHEPFLSSPDSVPTTAIANGSLQGPLPSGQTVQFTVGFQMSNETELAQIISEQSTPGSPLYHHWLSLADEQRMFAPAPSTVQNTINYFTSLGFHVGTRGVLSVSFTGAAGVADTAFRTQVLSLRTASGQIVPVNGQPLSLPQSIAPFVSGVNGFEGTSNIQVQHFIDPQLAAEVAYDTSHGLSPAASVVPAAPPGANVTNISAFYNFSNHAFGWLYWFSHNYQTYFTNGVISPGALSYLYDALPLVNAGYNGNSTRTPITIGIVMAGGINPDDLRTYGQEVWNNPNNILDRLSVLPVDGAFGLNGTQYYTDGASNEMALDIEYSSTMAPGAHILAVYGPGLYTTVLDDDYAALEALPTVPNIISNSWGGDEDTFGTGVAGPSWENALTMHQYIMLLTARGSSVLASTGDGGGFDPSTGMLAGSFPATDPYILGVNGIRTAPEGPAGGTYPEGANITIGWTNVTIVPGLASTNYELRIARATQIAYQSYWYVPFINTTLTRDPPEASGGFGTSDWFNQSWWQHGPFMPDLGRSLGSGVAAEADFNESIFFDGAWEFRYGGTSFACPTTAGMFALVEDYLAAHGQGRYFGNLNYLTTLVGNAWNNGNLTLNPYFDVSNGTSYWGNKGVVNGWSWPPGGKFPVGANGPTYGNTGPGWDFPTGWGVVNAANFARDASTLIGLPGQFATVTPNGLNWAPSAWGNLALNGTYTLHVNASSALQSTSPHVTLAYTDSSGTTTQWQPALSSTGVAPGYEFTIDTAAAPFSSPGYLYFEFGNAANKTLGFAYDWVAQDISASGHLAVTVITPSQSSAYPGGNTNFNAYLGWVPNIYDYPSWSGLPYVNTFTTLVTDNGVPVYDAVVTATIPTTNDIAWQGSIAAQRTAYRGSLGSAVSTNVISESFTNTVGEALVGTVNVIQPTPVTVTATYGPLSATTSYNLTTMPNVRANDIGGGNYSSFNFVRYLLTYFHQPVTQQYQNLWVPNSANQSAYYSMLYGWQGEELSVHVNDYTGASVPNANVWLGNLDIGHLTRFVNYEQTGGTYGITNTSGTANTTDLNGNTTIYIPDNQTAPVGFNFVSGPYAGQYGGLDLVATSLPGMQNRTFNYSEPCFPPGFIPVPGRLVPPLSCVYNSSYQRNYTTVPIVVFPNPITTWTETRQDAKRDFFGNGSAISWGVIVNLPNNDPFLGGIGTNWNPGLEHVVSVQAYVDGQPAGDLSPNNYGNNQYWYVNGNLTGDYGPGIHTLLVVVHDSLGHVFTERHIFIVGAITYTDLSPTNVYSLMPFNLTWQIDIPPQFVSNKTFNMSLEIRYVASGCGGVLFPCPQVVNLSIPIHPLQTSFSQSINRSLLEKNGFYSGADDLPPGQYELFVWLNANHSGSVQQMVPTYLVFDPLTAAIDGPGPNAQVPLGNVTISYSYSGQYVQGAYLSVYPARSTSPVFQVSALVPGIGGRGGSATWTSVSDGTYTIVLNLSTPYQNFTVSNTINVTSGSALVYLNKSAQSQPIMGWPASLTGTALTIIGAIVGLFLGLLLSGSLRPRRTAAGATGGAARPTARPWDETATPAGGVAGGGNVCSICHERFETPFALTQHGQVVHGIEE
jgi:subtilase family serine protease